MKAVREDFCPLPMLHVHKNKKKNKENTNNPMH